MKAELIDYMGTDLTVVNAARVSFDKESTWNACIRADGAPCECFGEGATGIAWDCGNLGGPGCLNEKDEKLIRYLSRNGHFTPFTHCTITLRETVPIFVARQRFKHTVGFSYNEVSRRYVDDTPEFYTPKVWRKRAENVKQGSSSEEALPANLVGIEEHHDFCAAFYQDLIDSGVAPEQARMVLPQSMYTSYYVTGSLAAFARSYNLRADSHAQCEIQELAKQWDAIIAPLFPSSWKALTLKEAIIAPTRNKLNEKQLELPV